ncbi:MULTISPECIES: hypothetical protein [unclassified Xanthobacter]|uniref:hypothetical protein n=1 Tax=unclassified Xanthobacter TaxID=2623496 RepID=UPI001EDFA70E|nr:MULTISPECIES: hypothetical protein [unclassified Xanthobacter]
MSDKKTPGTQVVTGHLTEADISIHSVGPRPAPKSIVLTEGMGPRPAPQSVAHPQKPAPASPAPTAKSGGAGEK